MRHFVRAIFILSVAGASIVTMYFTFPYIQDHINIVRAMMSPDLQYSKKQLSIGKNVLTVYVADNEAKRQAGLSNRESLPTTFGMLFEFPEIKTHGIWMKEMKFPIDIMWIDEKNTIVHIEENISPISFPHTFYPIESSKYVLEVNANYVEENKIRVGDMITVY